MRPRRKAAVKAAAAVNRPLSPSPMSSEDENFNSGFDDMDTGDNEIFSDEEDEIEEDDQQIINENLDDLESLSEQEQDEMEDDEDNEDIEDEMQDELQEEEEEDEDEEPILRKSTARINNKRKKPVIESDEEENEEEVFSDDAEIVRTKPMTKRQRAKAFHDTPEEYLELPMDTGKKKHLTEEEEQLKKSEVARRRKNQSIQRAEKDKADTINRLLKKQASKTKRVVDEAEDKESAHEKLKRLEDPNRLRYINTSKGSQLSIPTVYSIEQVFGSHSSPPSLEVKKCQVQGCANNRKYTAAKSGKYACSLEHYKLVESN